MATDFLYSALIDATAIVSLLSLTGTVLFSGSLFLRNRRAPHFLASLGEMGKFGALDQNTRLTIIVTARNEEASIERCLDSLVAQTFPNLEVLVVDDSSTDRTPEIVLGYAKVRLVRAGEKPAGWVGKSWPCWRGFEESTGDLLLFLDADCELKPQTCEQSVGYFLARGLDMMSLSPTVELRGVWSRAVMPFLSGIINLLYPMSQVNDPKSKRAYVFGAFILVRKSVYDAIGGHRAVRDRIVEDAAIAENAKYAGYKLRIETGKEFFSTEWEYRPRHLFHGLERVLTHSVRNYGLASILNAVLLFFVVLYPVFYSPLSATSLIIMSHSPGLELSGSLELGLLASLMSIVAMLLTTSLELKQVSGKAGPYPIFYPLGCAIFMAAIVTTTLKLRRGRGIEWKGKEYAQELAAAKSRGLLASAPTS